MSILSTVRLFAKNNSSSILTGFAITGVVTTGIFAGKASIKAEYVLADIRKDDPVKYREMDRKEKLKTVAPIFMPAFISGIATIFCICATHSIDTQKQVALMSAYSLSEHAMKSMEDTLSDKKLKQVKETIFEEDVKKNPPREESLHNTGKGKTKFRDGISGGDFIADIEYVKSVFNKYNKILNDGGIVYVNDIRWDFKLPQTEMGSMFGWDCGQLDEMLTSVILERDLQEVEEADVDNIFVISYNRPTILHHGY